LQTLECPFVRLVLEGGEFHPAGGDVGNGQSESDFSPRIPPNRSPRSGGYT
jgi:hypothetical protein